VVELTSFNVDPGSSRVYGDVAVNGKTAVTSAYIFTLNETTLKPLQSEGTTAILEGTKVFISPVAAELLNQTFKTDAVPEDLLVGGSLRSPSILRAYNIDQILPHLPAPSCSGRGYVSSRSTISASFVNSLLNACSWTVSSCSGSSNT